MPNTMTTFISKMPAAMFFGMANKRS